MTTEFALAVSVAGKPSCLWLLRTEVGVHLGTARDLPRASVDAADRALSDELGVSPEAVAVARRLAAEGVGHFESEAVDLGALREVARDAAAFASRVRAMGLRPRQDFVLLGEHTARGDVIKARSKVLAITLRGPVDTADFVDVRALADAWAEGSELPSPALSLALRLLSPDALEARGLVTSAWEVAPGVRMVPLRTPTIPPATHTNAFLIGESSMILVEPASPYDDEVDHLVELVERLRAEGRRLEGLVLTHHHPDHVGGAMALRARLGVPLLAHERTAERLEGDVEVDRKLVDGERIVLAGSRPMELDVLHTPGHAPGHVCLFERRSGALVAGDMVAGVGTILVEPHDGDMQLYLDSLARLKALGSTMILPAHGGVVRDPSSWLGFYVAHRLAREAKIVDALRTLGKPSSIGDLVPVAYADTSPMAWPLAHMSTAAHLDKLAKEGRVERRGEAWELVRGGVSSVN